jgi:hypothetical protein
MNPWEKSISFAPIANSSSTGLEPYNDHTRAAMLEALTSALTSRTMMTNGWSRLPRSTAKVTLEVLTNLSSPGTLISKTGFWSSKLDGKVAMVIRSCLKRFDSGRLRWADNRFSFFKLVIN